VCGNTRFVCIMRNIRLIARLDVKGPNVIKGVHFEGLRVMGKPMELAWKYYEEGADELLYMDIVASLYQRNNLLDIVEETAKHIFIPMTVGGGIRSLQDMEDLLRVGADKLAINTAAINDPNLITKGAKKYGSQCIVVSIEAKKRSGDRWEAYTDNGRNKTGLDVVKWAERAVDLGAGEILLTSVDKEGTAKGFDLELISKVTDAVSVPVITSGGAGGIEDFVECIDMCKVDAFATAHVLHYNKKTVGEIKEGLASNGVKVRLSYDP